MNNLTVKTKEAQFTVACEDAECNDLFRRIVKKLSSKLLGTEAGKSEINRCECGTKCTKSATKHWKCGTIAKKSEEIEEPKPEQQDGEALPYIPQNVPVEKVNTQPDTVVAAPQPPQAQRKYRGTMFVHCPHCGREFFYYQNEPSSECTRCNCGNTFRLEDMKSIRAYCKCGNQIRAMTNESSSVITIICHTCGAPLDLEYNKKENRYENMG